MRTRDWIQHVPSFIFLIVILVLILNSPLNTLPAHDEIVSITTFLDFRTLFLKYLPNNHTITGFAGFIINSIFGVNILYLRFISFFLLILIVTFVSLKEKDSLIPLLFLATYVSYNALADYSFLFRGYYFMSFSFVIIFYLLKNIDKDDKNIKYIFILSSLLIIHNLGSIYLVLPLIIFLTIFIYKKKKIELLKYFIFPTLFYYLISIPVTGAYVKKDLLFTIISEKLYFEHLYLIFILYYEGLKEIISPKLLEDYPTIIANYKIFFDNFYYNKILLLIFFISFLKSFVYIFIKRRIIDLSIFFLFFVIIILNKIPPERLLISYLFFFILYLINDINLSNYKFFKFIIVGKIILCLFISFQITKFNILSSNEINIVTKKTNDSIEKKCILKLSSDNQFDYHYFYYIYLLKCKKKPNIIEFYNFYKTKLI